MQRTCPSCKSSDEFLGDYFCLSCGVKLPSELTTLDVRSEKIRLNPPPFVVKSQFLSGKDAKFLIVFSFILLTLFASVFGLARLFSLSKTSSQPTTGLPSAVTAERTLELPGLLGTSKQFDTALTSAIPPEADFLLQGNSLKEVLVFFFGLGDESELPVLGMKVSDFLSVSSEDFAFASLPAESSTSARTYLLVSKAKTDDLSKLKEFASKSNLVVDEVDNTLLIATSDTTLKNAKNAKNKVSLNLTLNSKYATARNALPKEGKLLIYLGSEKALTDLTTGKDLFKANSKYVETLDTIIERDKSSFIVK